MKLKIIKCSNKNYWYSGKIGNTFEVISSNYRTSQHIIEHDVLFFWGGKCVDFEDAVLFETSIKFEKTKIKE